MAKLEARCPSCGKAAPASAVNVAKMVAKCEACGELFDFSDQVEQQRTERDKAPVAPVPLPPGLKIERDESGAMFGDYRHAPRAGGRLVIRRRWFRWSLIPLLGFCVFWDGFLVVWYSTVLTGGAPAAAAAFPLLHVAVGIGLTYTTLAGLFNSTTIVVGDGRLSVRHGPIPWVGNRNLPTDEIRQLYTERLISSGKSKKETFTIHAIVASGPTIPVVSRLDEITQALYIEKEIERNLGIEDERVPGAVDS
jgi:hypothetical protein